MIGIKLCGIANLANIVSDGIIDCIVVDQQQPDWSIRDEAFKATLLPTLDAAFLGDDRLTFIGVREQSILLDIRIRAGDEAVERFAHREIQEDVFFVVLVHSDNDDLMT